MRRRDFKNADWNDPIWQERMKEYQENRNKNKIFFGIGLIIFGLIWFCTKAFNLDIDWSDNWPFILIAIGILIGIKRNFTNNAWWILCLIGVVNLVDNYYPQYVDYVWPVALILGGLAITLKPRKKKNYGACTVDNITDNNLFNIDVTFGGRKEIVTSKEFVGGRANVTFAGCEINFMQAEMVGPTAELDLKVSFGGLEIILPSHWEVRNEINPSFGNVEDERGFRSNVNTENRKTLILRGDCSFGNIEIKSY